MDVDVVSNKINIKK